MFNISSKEVRLFFAQVWQKRFALDLQPMEKIALKIILAHPEYHSFLEKIDDYLETTWCAHQGEMNPFLHLSLHLSLQEQVSIDQPPGIAEIHRRLCARYQGWLPAEHRMMEALIEMIGNAQLSGRGFDVNAYLTQLRRLIGQGPEEVPRKNPHEI